jgi:hypothetical protein
MSCPRATAGAGTSHDGADRPDAKCSRRKGNGLADTPAASLMVHEAITR